MSSSLSCSTWQVSNLNSTNFPPWKLTWERNITSFSRRYILIHGCFSSQSFVFFFGGLCFPKDGMLKISVSIPLEVWHLMLLQYPKIPGAQKQWKGRINFWGKGYVNSACGLFQWFGRSHVKVWSSWKAGRSELTRIDLEMDRTHFRQTWRKTKISKFVGSFVAMKIYWLIPKNYRDFDCVWIPNTIENHHRGFKPICFYKLMCMKR